MMTITTDSVVASVKPSLRTFFHMKIETNAINTINPVRNNLMAANVPIQVPKSFPSDTLLMCAVEKPRSVIILNNEMNDMANPIVPSASGAKPPHSFASITIPIHPRKSVKKCVVTIRKDFRAIMLTEQIKKMYING